MITARSIELLLDRLARQPYSILFQRSYASSPVSQNWGPSTASLDILLAHDSCGLRALQYEQSVPGQAHPNSNGRNFPNQATHVPHSHGFIVTRVLPTYVTRLKLINTRRFSRNSLFGRYSAQMDLKPALPPRRPSISYQRPATITFTFRQTRYDRSGKITDGTGKVWFELFDEDEHLPPEEQHGSVR
jgi:hypothetical protein